MSYKFNPFTGKLDIVEVESVTSTQSELVNNTDKHNPIIIPQITVSAVAPVAPYLNQLWYDIS